jgi:hypothetical protein
MLLLFIDLNKVRKDIIKTIYSRILVKLACHEYIRKKNWPELKIQPLFH